MVEGRASKHWHYFIDTFLLYQTLFDNSESLNTILATPYPLYHDVILRQIEEKKKEKQKFDQKLKNKNKGL